MNIIYHLENSFFRDFYYKENFIRAVSRRGIAVILEFKVSNTFDNLKKKQIMHLNRLKKNSIK